MHQSKPAERLGLCGAGWGERCRRSGKGRTADGPSRDICPAWVLRVRFGLERRILLHRCSPPRSVQWRETGWEGEPLNRRLFFQHCRQAVESLLYLVQSFLLPHADGGSRSCLRRAPKSRKGLSGSWWTMAGCQDFTGVPKWTGAKSRIADLDSSWRNTTWILDRSVAFLCGASARNVVANASERGSNLRSAAKGERKLGWLLFLGCVDNMQIYQTEKSYTRFRDIDMDWLAVQPE